MGAWKGAESRPAGFSPDLCPSSCFPGFRLEFLPWLPWVDYDPRHISHINFLLSKLFLIMVFFTALEGKPGQVSEVSFIFYTYGENFNFKIKKNMLSLKSQEDALLFPLILKVLVIK